MRYTTPLLLLATLVPHVAPATFDIFTLFVQETVNLPYIKSYWASPGTPDQMCNSLIDGTEYTVPLANIASGEGFSFGVCHGKQMDFYGTVLSGWGGYKALPFAQSVSSYVAGKLYA